MMSYINTAKVSKTNAPGIKVSNDKFVGNMTNSIYYNGKYYYAKNSTVMTNGAKLGDIVTPADSDFITLSVPAMGTDFHTVWRNADGSLNPAGFAETPENGTYAKLGYHMSDGSSQPVVTTVSTQPVQTTTTTTTTTTSTESNYLAGDANVDGKVDISDAVMILQVIANSDKYGVNGSSDTHITEQGILNGDVYKKGSGLTTQDALSIQKYVAQLITALPES